MADENPIELLTPGQILADSAVTDYIKAMGIAIAEAQMQLDINSLSQVAEYAEPRKGLRGKSLLQLGLFPPFYHYQHADLSVSMQIVMKIAEQTAFGIGAKLDFGFEQGGPVAAAKAREAQVTLKSVPASVTVDGKKTDASGSDVEAAAEQLATALRTPAGPFDRAFINTERKPVTATLEPVIAKNPILTSNAVAFLKPAASSAAVIRIVQTPPPLTSEAFTLANTKVATVGSEANRTLYARKVVEQINALTGFKARLVNDAGGSNTAPDSPGVFGIALFDTNEAKIKAIAGEELDLIAKTIKDGNFTVNVVGYADTRGTEADNLKLGENRAKAVAAHLMYRGVPTSKIPSVTSGGEARWQDAPANTDNQQFRRAEIVLAGSTDLIILVEDAGTQLQATPTPDMTAGGSGNGFIFARNFNALPIDGTAVKLGASATSVAIKKDAVNTGGDNFAEGTPEACALNLVRDINSGTATHKVRATRSGGVVVLANADDAVVIDLVTLSVNEIKLEAAGGASVTTPLAGIVAGPTASKDKPKVTAAVGITVDYRKSRQFEQSVNGNSSISARLVAVPAPVEFLEEIKTYLNQLPKPNPPQG